MFSVNPNIWFVTLHFWDNRAHITYLVEKHGDDHITVLTYSKDKKREQNIIKEKITTLDVDLNYNWMSHQITETI